MYAGLDFAVAIDGRKAYASGIMDWKPQDVTRHELLLNMYGATHNALYNL